jgi:mono/diheme cytochrome c family protein
VGVKSTKVPVVLSGNLSFVPGLRVEFRPANRENECCGHSFGLGGRVNRNFLIFGIAVLSVAGALLAQDPPAKTAPKAPAKKSAPAAAAGSAARGKETFAKKCAVCHYPDSDAKKIGPGLKGLSKRGTFSVNNNKITGDSLKAWIENGDTLMPPFKDVLEEGQIKDVIAYVKTL